MVKNLWMCWFQGEDDPNMPRLNRTCIDRWVNLNKDSWKISILTNENIPDIIPEYYHIINDYGYPFARTRTNKSELIRTLLLEKYGGVWADSTTYPMLPLDDFYSKIVNDTGFFAYRFLTDDLKPDRQVDEIKGTRETVSWFVCADQPNHYLMSKHKTEMVKRYLRKCNYKYYTFHDVLANLYDSDVNIKHIIDNMIQIPARVPHSAILKWGNRKKSYIYKRPALPKKLLQSE